MEMSPKRKTTAIGLDISNSSAKVAEVEIERGEATLSNLGIIHLPEGIIRDGEIEDPETLSGLLKELWNRSGIKGKRVILGIANQKVIVRPIELPYMEREELDSALRFQVQEFIPIPTDDAILDFEIIEEFMTAEEERMLTVLLVAAHRDMIQSFIGALQGAGLSLDAIDLKAFALPRSLVKREYQLAEEAGEEESTCIVNIGAGITNIVILKDKTPRFARFLLRGGNDFTTTIMDRLDMDIGEAEEVRTGKLVNEEAGKILQQEIFNFVGEVRRSIDYYVAQTQERNLASVIIAGSGSKTLNLPQEINRGLRLPVEIGKPFQNLQLGKLAFAPEELADIEPSVAVCIGLALREVLE
jgi:type IV pilus assembly protein PilM